MTPYIAYPDIQGIIYQDDIDRNHLMRTDELHKFSDDTLNHVRTALNDIATGIQIEYLPKRKWTKQDKQRARVMINAIDKKLKDTRHRYSNLMIQPELEGSTQGYPLDNVEVLRKQAHASHKAKNMVSTKRCLELLHMDLFSPSAIKSYGGNLYTLIVVDDYSRYTWTKFLKTKNEAFEKFEILSKKIQNQLGSSIVAIRTDHGQEFDNEVQFGAYCDAQGITYNFSAPRTPQSNGVVERKNRTLQEMSSTMLNEQSIPQKFWCNAVDTSTYILNRNLIRPILGKTLYEIFREDELIEVDEVVNIKESKNHPLEQVIEPKNVNEALGDESWVVAMQEELNQFVANDVWDLVPLPMSQTIIGTKWVFRNKLDKNGIVSRNKARLVAQGYNQQEGIEYDKTYAPVARLESIRILLAIACANDFKLYQMDVKSAFLNGFINEEVYVAQPPGFIDFEKPNYVYKLKKALYGLQAAPSMIGELNFFLGLQIKQMEDEIFFNQSKYIKEMLKKFGLEDSKPTKTPMSTEIKFTKDDEANYVDYTKYQGMIGSLLYLTASRPDIMFSVSLCARFQENPKTTYLEAVKRIFSNYGVIYEDMLKGALFGA
ncbi:retrovirus-related pol polyprotein from transposon TNT 1-94 [Tanacetum coccineum]